MSSIIMCNETNHAREQAEAKLESIKTLVLNYTLAMADTEHDNEEAAMDAITSFPLSVEVRDDNWYANGSAPTKFAPTQFRILLCWGGPAVQITGEVHEHGRPAVTSLQYQDWGTPWTEYFIDEEDYADVQSFVEHFYFGE